MTSAPAGSGTVTPWRWNPRSGRLRSLVASATGRGRAPAVLLVVVAIIGVRNHIVRDQSSWQGASFGMFATYENHVSRLVVVTVTGPDGSFRARAARRTWRTTPGGSRVAPTRRRGSDRLAEAVAERVGDQGATEVEVALWRIELDGRRRAPPAARRGRWPGTATP